MTLSVGGTRLRAHPLMLLFPLITAGLGARGDAAAMLAALAAHEGAHLAMARALGVRVSQLRLMPFGGAIAAENPYALDDRRLLAVAAAGPIGSLAALLLSAALAQWGAIPPGFSLSLANANLLMLAFNLLPALPLDGGRMAVALLAKRVGRERAVDLGILAGRVAAAALLAMFAWTGLARGRFNLSFALCAAFMLASPADERRALTDARAKALLNALTPVEGPVPARLVAVGEGCAVRDALRSASPSQPTLFAVFSGGRLRAFTDDRRLLDAALEDEGAPVSACGGIPAK